MKKVMIMAAAILFSFATKAQGVHFGVKGGLNASELHGDNITDAKTKIGFHAGVLAHIHTANKSWAIQPELMYSSEGAKYKESLIGGTSPDYKLDMNMINLPVLVQYMFDNGFRIEAGPQVGYLLSAKLKPEEGSSSTDLKDNFKKINFSIPVGIGYLTRSGLGFDARYNFGISDLNDTDGGSKITGNNFQFGLFYQFSDTKK